MTSTNYDSQTAFLSARSNIEPTDVSISYQSVPTSLTDEERENRPVWRIQLHQLDDPDKYVGLDIYDEIILGRGVGDTDLPKLIPLNKLGFDTTGVSRHHLLLRPTSDSLFAIDNGSTNGSSRNGHPLGVRIPYALNNGDVVTLGKLSFSIHIIRRPQLQTGPINSSVALANALARIARAITAQLNLEEVLNKVTETAMALTAAGEIGIWLVDDRTGELFLEAQRGIHDEHIRRMRLPLRGNKLVEQVMRTGKPLRSNRQPGEEQIKLKTSYLVEAVIYVPIQQGGITLGVIVATHREPGHHFTKQDEHLLNIIADFAAIAIHNARLHQATDQALAQRVKELGTLNQVMHAVSASLDLREVYQILVAEIEKHIAVADVRLFLLDEEGTSMFPMYAEINIFANPSQRFRRGILWEAAQKGEVSLLTDVTDYPEYNPEADSLDGRAPDSLLVIPLRSQSVVGVLVLYDKLTGEFNESDIQLMKSFSIPVATAIKNARIFARSERQRRAIQFTARALSEPLLFVDEEGNMLIVNDAAQKLVSTHMSELFAGLSQSVNRTTEFNIAEKTYIGTSQHLSEVGTIFVMQDITYVKQLEEERSEFIHALSHDLKNPLMSVRGWAEVLHRRQGLDALQMECVNGIVAASERMVDMIGELLAAVDQPITAQIEYQSCDLDQIVDRIKQDVAGAARGKEIGVTFGMEGEPYLVYGDEMRLYHMVLNLVDNAIKYSPAGSHVEVQLRYQPKQISITVADEGQGIPEADLERIFEKYFRSSQTGPIEGSGVGLATVRSIAEAHGGTVAASNRPVGGALFTITLPRRQPEALLAAD